MSRNRVLSFFVVVALFLNMLPTSALAKTVEELKSELQDQQASLKATQDKIDEFKQNLQEKKQEARTLEDQIGLIDSSITSIELELEKTQKEIEKNNLEIESVQQDIQIKEDEINRQKETLADLIRSLYQLDQQSTVTVLLKYNTFSEAMTESNTIAELQDRAHQALVEIQKLHDELMTKKRELEDYKQTLEALQTRQQKEQDLLASQRDSKQNILNATNEQKAQYNSLLSQAQAEYQASQAAITDINSKIAEELKKQGIGSLPSVGTFDWPITPIFGISCGFHCSGYPYAYLIGPHSGDDIPTPVGTPILAPAEGYVARTHDSGGTGYSYIMLVHGDNLSTIYGHVSGFAVKEGQVVTRGTVIGYTGGAPGTHGAGLSSGPHLHFEVRLNNVPVDPLKYLGPMP